MHRKVRSLQVALDKRYANKFAPLDSTAIYPKPGHILLLYTPMTDEMEMPYGYTFALCIPLHLLQVPMQHMHQHDQ